MIRTILLCDRCDGIFHLSCIKVTKTEKKARKNSKCLLLYCTECIEDQANGTAAKIKDMLKLLYKLEFVFQEKKSIGCIAKRFVESYGRTIKKSRRIVSNNNCTVVGVSNIRTTVKSYANAVKRGTVKPAVVVQPKTQQTCAQTLEDITKKVNKEEVQVCGTRNVRNGGIVLRCDNAKETMKVKQIVREKLGDGYEIVLPKVKLPRLRITNINEIFRKMIFWFS